MLTPKDDQNQAAYGATCREILSGTATPKPLPGVDELIAALTKAAS